MTLKYVTIKKMAELTGYSEQAIRDKIHQGVWSPHMWVKAPDNRILVNTEEYEKWAETDAECDQLPKAQLKSPSCIKANNARSGSHLSPPPLT